MKKIGLLFNPVKNDADKRSAQVSEELKKLGFEVWSHPTSKDFNEWDDIDKDTDLVVVFGGDGTFLQATRKIHHLNIPVMGINHGHLGFLAEYGDIEAKDLAKQIKEKNFVIEERVMIQASIPQMNRSYTALNDIVVSRPQQSNLLYTDLYVDGDLLHSFRADGIVICTPTGSTAYALSAGGAVMDPNIRAFQIVPIAAHSLNSRPHVISNEQTIILESKDDTEYFLQADGQELVRIEPKVNITVTKAPHTLKLVKLKRENRSFYNVLRDKMKWGSINN